MKWNAKAIRISMATALALCLIWTQVLAQAPLLEAIVSDMAGKPVEGAKLFLYGTSDVRRPADYISSPSDRSGKLQMAVPPGTYWAVARHKKDEKFGPLMPGDKHSGEPVEIEVKPDTGSRNVFTVADIRELGQKKSAHAADSLKVTGRVVDAQEKPLPNAYGYAHSTRDVDGLPEYISTWTDEEGSYVLYIPLGRKYFLGAATEFPPKSALRATREFDAAVSQIDIAIPVDLIVK
jgi:hypothetical protein